MISGLERRVIESKVFTSLPKSYQKVATELLETIYYMEEMEDLRNLFKTFYQRYTMISGLWDVLIE